jgi:arylsulfatase
MKWFRLWRQMRDVLAIVSCFIAQPLFVETASAQQTSPNILFILADNIG